MTDDHLPAIRPAAELVNPATDSWTAVVNDVALFASKIADTEFVPRGLRGSPAAVAAAILYGREVGLPPMAALQSVHVVEGRPSMSAEMLRALVLAAGHEIVYEESSGAICHVKGRRAGSETWTHVTWTLDMARAAELTGKTNWKRYPRAMLLARATAELCRMVFADITHGIRATEELDEVEGADDATRGAHVDPPARTKVQRKTRRTEKRDDGAAPAPSGVEGPTVPAAPSSPPMPPLPGEPEPAGQSAGDESESVAGGPVENGEPDPGSGPAADGAWAAEPLEAEGAGQSTAGPAPEAGDEIEDAEVVEDEDRPRPAMPAQLRGLHAVFNETGYPRDDRDARLHVCTVIVGREVASSNDLTYDEARKILDALSLAKTRDEVEAIVVATEQHNERKDADQ